MQFGMQYFPVRGADDDAGQYFHDSLELAVEADQWSGIAKL